MVSQKTRECIRSLLSSGEYYVDEMGNIWTRRRGNGGLLNSGKWKKTGSSTPTKKYWMICFNYHLIRRSNIVYFWFFGNIPEGYIIHHKDENKINDDPLNLELKTLSSHTSEHLKNRPVSLNTRKKISHSIKNVWEERNGKQITTS